MALDFVFVRFRPWGEHPRENKNIYQTTQEALHLTREAAGELLESIPPERIEKIENERSLPHPDEVLTMAEKSSSRALQLLLRQSVPHRAGVCAGGEDQGPLPDRPGNAGILNSMNRRKDRLIEITADGVISDDVAGGLHPNPGGAGAHLHRGRDAAAVVGADAGHRRHQPRAV